MVDSADWDVFQKVLGRWSTLLNNFSSESRIHVGLDHILQINLVQSKSNPNFIVSSTVDFINLAGRNLHSTELSLKFIEAGVKFIHPNHLAGYEMG